MSFCHVVGLSYEGIEDQMLALFSMIKAIRRQNRSTGAPDLCFKPVNKGNREKLVCSINYNIMRANFNTGKGKGKGSNCSL